MSNPSEAAAEIPSQAGDVVDTLADGTIIKRLLVRQRACNQKDARSKLCTGHLKRWYFFGEQIQRKFGPDAEIYRCQRCKTLYLPDPGGEPRSGTLRW